MNSLIASILSLVILFQSFGFSTDFISKISEVVEHAKFHNDEYGDDLMVFISKHYGELMTEHQKDNDKEKEQHEELPFKQLSSLSSSLLLVLFNEPIEITAPILKDAESHIFIYKSPFSSFFLDKQLRPPRNS